MKKICFILVLCSFMTSLPSYAMKIIVNDQNDRVVYSRSSRPDNDAYYEETYTNTDIQHNENYILQQPDYGQLKELSENLKPEMIGTTWDYSHNDEENPQISDSNIDENNNEDREIDTSLKRNSREAADYFTRDINYDPGELIPSGYLPEI